MKKFIILAISVLVIGIFTGLGIWKYTIAKSPFSNEDLQEMNKELLKLVEEGDRLWHSPELGTNGLTCGNCHPDAANSNPHTFPKFQTNAGDVITLREMINWCIKVPLEGKELPHDSPKMKALEAYSIYMYKNQPLKPGDNTKEYPSNPVKSGPGYP